jgi:hypothetical protein
VAKETCDTTYSRMRDTLGRCWDFHRRLEQSGRRANAHLRSITLSYSYYLLHDETYSHRTLLFSKSANSESANGSVIRIWMEQNERFLGFSFLRTLDWFLFQAGFIFLSLNASPLDTFTFVDVVSLFLHVSRFSLFFLTLPMYTEYSGSVLHV